MLLERFEHADLNLARVSILLHRADHLDRDFASRLDMARFDDFAKRSLAK